MRGSSETAKPYPKALEWLRYLCAFFLYMYGGSKLAHMQLNLPLEYASRPIGSLTGYELTWYYYGYSYTYAFILGLAQVLGASLLLFQRTALAGAALILPVIGNIVMINMFILRNDYGPYVISVFILISMLLILWHSRDEMLSALWIRQPSESPDSRRRHGWIRALIITSALGLLTFGLIVRPAR
jgi:hypothetical protein